MKTRQKNLRSGQVMVETGITIVLITGCIVWTVKQFEGIIDRPFAEVTFGSQTNDLSPETRIVQQSGSQGIGEQPVLAKLWNSNALMSAIGFSSVIALSYLAFLRPKKETRKTRQSMRKEFKDKVINRQFAMPKSLFNKREAIIDKFLIAMARETGVRVEDIMSHDPVIISKDATVARLERIMKQKGIHHLIVGDSEERTMVGIISDRDLAKASEAKAVDVLSNAPITVSSSEDIHHAISTMLNNRISCLPVVDDGKVVGVISLSDLAVALQCTLIVLQDFFVSSAPFCTVPKPDEVSA